MKYNKKELLFKYKMIEEFSMQSFELTILDRESDNIFMTTSYGCQEVILPFLFPEDLDKIKKIINNDKLFKIEELEYVPVCDGYSETFTFNNGKLVKELYGSNFSYLDIKNTEYAKIVVKVFNSISRIVYKRTFVKMPLK